jgi:hypothetical protein
LLDANRLKDLLHGPKLTRQDQVLLALAIGDNAKSVADVRSTAVGAGLRRASKWNMSSLLSRSVGLAVRTGKGWELTQRGRLHVQKLSGIQEPRIVNVAESLRAHLATIVSTQTRAFLEEAVGCFEHGFHRAAIVLSWAGAVSTLHKHVVDNRLTDFNNEAARRTAASRYPWKPAKTTDDLGAMGEYDFLQVLVAINVISKNVKDRLEGALKLRNGCGHPTSLTVATNEAAAHIEALIQNVFAKL